MDVDDTHLSVRLRHGIHSIFLFVDPLQPFSAVTAELLDVLRERYPNGLTTSQDSAKRTQIPAEPVLAYGVLNVPTDPSRGWKRLKLGEEEQFTPNKCGIKNNSIVAFTFIESDAAEDDVEFEVEWPREDEEMYEQAA